DELLGQARLEADNIKKEAELKAKDSVLKEREQFNKDVGTKQGEIREQERRLEKKEDLLEQKHQAQQKKERELDHVKKKLSERRDLLDKGGQEVDVLLQKQTAKLHEITSLSREQAEQMLLERLDKELAPEMAARIQKAEEAMRAASEEKARK